MGYYTRKEKRKQRIKCCCCCNKGLRGRWWWRENVLSSDGNLIKVNRFHPECGMGKTCENATPEYRCEGDRQAFVLMHSNTEILRAIYKRGTLANGRRITGQGMVAEMGQGRVPETPAQSRMGEVYAVAAG